MNKNNNNQPGPTGFPGKTVTFILLLLIIMVTVFFISKNKNTSITKNESHSDVMTASVSAEPVTKTTGEDEIISSRTPDHQPAEAKSGVNKSSQKELTGVRPQTNDKKPIIIGITIGLMDLVFNIDEGKSVSISPEANKALTQIKKDGFEYIHMMEPFARGYMKKFPSLSVQAVKLLVDKGFKVLITINGSPFINGDAQSETKWVYRYFPGNDLKGKDDDGGLAEHKRRLTAFMDALQAEGLMPHLQFQLFDEPNSKKSFWGTYKEFEQLLAANIEVITLPKYGIAKSDILGPAFTSNMMLNGDNATEEHRPYWNFAKSYKENALVNQFPFSFNWYPVSGSGKNAKNFRSSDIKIPQMYEGAWITGMNVSAYMTRANLQGKGANRGYREMNTFKEKAEDIIQYAQTHHMAGIYFFNLINRKDQPNEKGRIGTGLFNSEGCPRKEYKDLLNILNRPVNFAGCPDPDVTGD